MDVTLYKFIPILLELSLVRINLFYIYIFVILFISHYPNYLVILHFPYLSLKKSIEIILKTSPN